MGEKKKKQQNKPKENTNKTQTKNVLGRVSHSATVYFLSSLFLTSLVGQ